jgi:tetratricopeptide (TPR) repeat protein
VVAVAVVSAIVLVVACSSRSETTPAGTPVAAKPADRQTLRPVTLPDLSKASPPVQQQVREAYALLNEAKGKPGIADADLARAYGDLGKLLMAAEFREAAEPCLLDAQALAPTELRWPYYLGHLSKLRGDPAGSTTHFEEALRLAPDDVPTLVWLGNVYLDAGRVDDAERLFSKALSTQPRLAAAMYGVGRAALAKREYARAIDYLEQAQAQDPKAVTIHYQLALAYRGKGEADKAEMHMRLRGPGEVRAPDPLMKELDALLESSVAYEVRGAQALDEGRWTDAAAYFRKGAALDPNEPSLLHKLGTALAMSGDSAGAFQQFEEVTRRWPHFAKAQYSLGVMLAGAGRYPEAVAHLQSAVTSEPSYVEAHLQLAESLRAMGRMEQSLAEYDETTRLDPRVAEARFGAAMALAKLGRIDQARQRLMEGARLHPERPEFSQALAQLP